MSGILGLFSFDGRPAVLSDLETLAAASRRRAPGGQCFWVSSCFGLGHQRTCVTLESNAEEQPLVSSSGFAVALDGRIDNRLELAPHAAARAAEAEGAPSDAALVLGAYEHAGDRFASYLNGDFAVALADPGRRHLLLARDIMGARRLHYTRVGQTLLFASEIKSLLAFPGVGAIPDDDGLADIVLDRWVEGGCTGFKGIYSVPPGHTIIATPDKVSVRQQWAFDPGREIRYRSPGEYVERFRELFEQSVLRRMRTSRPIAVSVSGGFDSSSIFCQALALKSQAGGLPPVYGLSTIFPPGSASDEREFLDVLDVSSGHPITRLPMSSAGLMSHAEACIEQTEMPALTWTPQSPVLDEAQRSGCSVMLDGYFGDQMLFPRSYLLDLARRGRWLPVRRELREFSTWMADSPDGYPEEFWSRLFRSMIPRPVFQAAKKGAARRRAARYPAWYTGTFVSRVIERQLTRLPRAPKRGGSHAMECYRAATAGHYLLQVQRQTAEALTRGLEAAYPFRDRDLVAFLMAIPGEVVSWRGVPKAIAREALTDILPPPVRDRRWKADFTEVTNQAALHDYGKITRLLTPSAAVVAGGFADGGVIEESVLACKATLADNNSAVAGWELSQLVALELWLRRFCGLGPSCTTS